MSVNPQLEAIFNPKSIAIIGASKKPGTIGNQVMQNLLDNAAKFMGDQKEPCIHVGKMGEDGDGWSLFFVRDNGLGIAPEHFERIFGLFNKLDPRSEGTGIGLTLVKRIIEVHGGKTWV